MRRLRKSPALREMLTSVRLNPSDLIYPIFVDENASKPVPVASMPGILRFPVAKIVDEAKQAMDQKIKAVILFGLPSKKEATGSEAYNSCGVIQKATYDLKKQFGDDLVVIGDVCMCEYTDHGHCGLLKGDGVDNDSTLELLGKIAVTQAQAGVDIVAPSAMMDGQVLAIREALDDEGFEDVSIMGYSAKYCSGFYGPFRDAADSAPKFGNRKCYQMNYFSSKEAMREIELDVNEGADFIMVKPALAYLDIISLAKSRFDLPIVAYNVSGEYSMIKAAAQNGWIDEKSVVIEMLTSIKRAGADLLITYFAKEINQWLNQKCKK
jgi:porphobilinogen synthase